MRVKRSLAVFGLLCGLTAIAAACGGDKEEPTRVPTPVFSPTPAPAAGATSAPAPTATVAAQPAATEPAATEPPATEPPAGPAGDAANGEKVFAANGCSGCHSTGSNQIVGPGLAGLFERSAARVAGLSAAEYVEQSIRDPGAFVVDGFPAGVMPSTFGGLPDSDIQDLIAYLATLK